MVYYDCVEEERLILYNSSSHYRLKTKEKSYLGFLDITYIKKIKINKSLTS